MWKALGVLLLIGVLAVGLLLLLALNSEPVPPFSEQVKTLSEAERQALEQLANDAGMPVASFRSLGGYYQGLFDAPQNRRAVWIEQGQVRALRLQGWPNAAAPDLSALRALEVLWLDQGQLSELPDLSALAALTELNLREQPITELPAAHLPPALVRINLAGTRIASLDHLAQIETLKHIDASRTPVRDFSRLVPLALDRLDLHDTQIAAMPATLPRKGQGDWSVNLDNTPVLNPPGHSWTPPADYRYSGVALGAESKDGMIGNGVVDVTGTGAEIVAMRPVILPTHNDQGGVYTVQIDASIETGQARIWLGRPPSYFLARSPWFREVAIDGFGLIPRNSYVFADLEPGKPASLIGQLRLPGPVEHWDFEFQVEPLGSEKATGFRYHVGKAPSP